MKLVLDFNYHIWKIVINDGKSNECFQMWLNLIWFWKHCNLWKVTVGGTDEQLLTFTNVHVLLTFSKSSQEITYISQRSCSDNYEHPINISPEKRQTYLKPVHYTSSCNPIDLKFHCLIDKRKDNQKLALISINIMDHDLNIILFFKYQNFL